MTQRWPNYASKFDQIYRYNYLLIVMYIQIWVICLMLLDDFKACLIL